MSNRLDALSAQLDAPVLVTDLTNVFYLTGFDSSNAALLVEPGGGATLFTDFRYAESAREVPDVDVQMTKRAMMADIGARLKGRVQFEADVLPHLGIASRRFDIAYVDGSHRAADVYSDAVLTWPMVAANGVVIFDDYEFDQMEEEIERPKLGIDAFLKAIDGQYRLIHKDYQVVIEKIAGNPA